MTSHFACTERFQTFKKTFIPKHYKIIDLEAHIKENEIFFNFDLPLDEEIKLWKEELNFFMFSSGLFYEFIKPICCILLILEKINTSFQDDLNILFDALQRTKDIHASSRSRGHVFSFGKNDYQLGFGCDKSIQTIPTRVCATDVSFKTISSARFHNIAISHEGKMYAWGKGENGRLGLGNMETYLLPTMISFKTPVQLVSCGRDHSLCLSESGEIFSWGSGKHGQLGLGANQVSLTPTKVNFPISGRLATGLSFIHAATSNTHSMAIGRDGQVFCWGKNDSSQLGYRSLSANDKIKSFPHVVLQEAFSDPCCAYASENVSIVLTKEGKVFQWGHGNYHPFKISFKKESSGDDEWHTQNEAHVTMTTVSAGPFHCAAISEIGEVYTWGASADLLGFSVTGNDRNSKSHSCEGRRVEKLWNSGRIATHVSVSKMHSCVIDSLGCLWVWGHGDQGVLGLQSNTYQPDPKQVPFLRNISFVSAAECHSSVILNEITGEAEYPSGLAELKRITQEAVLKKTDMFNVLNTLRFALFGHLGAVVSACNKIIAHNFSPLICSHQKVFHKLCEIQGLETRNTESRMSLVDITTPKISPIPKQQDNQKSRRKSIVCPDTTAILVPKIKTERPQKFDNGGPLVHHNGTNDSPNENLHCKACGIMVPDSRAMVDHVAGKKHRKKVEASLEKEEIYYSPKPVQPMRSDAMEPMDLGFQRVDRSSERPRRLLNLRKLELPHAVLMPLKKGPGEPEPNSTPAKEKFSLSDLLVHSERKFKGKNTSKPKKEWKPASIELLGPKKDLSSIMEEQLQSNKNENVARVKVTESQWGLTDQAKLNFLQIQEQQHVQQQEAREIEEQRQLLEYYANLKRESQKKTPKKFKPRPRRRKAVAT